MLKRKKLRFFYQNLYNMTKQSAEHIRKRALAITGEKHPLWKGNAVGYKALHGWIYRHFGSATRCEYCWTLKAKKYEWANISGIYKRDIKDFVSLCASCHDRLDRNIDPLVKSFVLEWSQR
jgi:hypothetical protein